MNTFEAAVAKRLFGFERAGRGVSARPRENGVSVFLAAVSGGADSTAMLAALAAIRDGAAAETAAGDNSGSLGLDSPAEDISKKPFILRCLHVEHGIRPPRESRGDAAAVRALCGKLKVPCKVVHVPQGRIERAALRLKLGIEGAARLYRHAIWNRELKRLGADRILVGHTKDDILETILMRTLRGSGPAGLASIAGERGAILRPLLDLSRREVLSYLDEKGLSFRTDETNKDTRYLRNRIRHKLIPRLDNDFPFWRSSLENLGETQRLVSDFLLEEAERRLCWEKVEGGLRIPLSLFLSEKPILREESFFGAVDRLASKGRGEKSGGLYPRGFCPPSPPRRSSVRRFLVSLENGESRIGSDLGPVRAERQGAYLLLKAAEKTEQSGGFSLLIKEKGSYTLKNRFVVTVEEPGAPLPPEGEGLFFYAGLPLVLRGETGVLAAGQKRRFSAMIKNPPRYRGEIISAVDRKGIAALLGIAEAEAGKKCRSRGGKPLLLFKREGESGDFCFSVRIMFKDYGGLDV